jgi:hypothetical protein
MIKRGSIVVGDTTVAMYAKKKEKFLEFQSFKKRGMVANGM